MAKKNPFDALPETFKDALEGSTVEQLKEKLAEIAKDEAQNQSAKKADEDLLDKQEAVRIASQGYNDLTKLNKLKTKYVIGQLADKGDPVAESIIRLDLQAAALKA